MILSVSSTALPAGFMGWQSKWVIIDGWDVVPLTLLPIIGRLVQSKSCFSKIFHFLSFFYNGGQIHVYLMGIFVEVLLLFERNKKPMNKTLSSVQLYMRYGLC